MLQKINTIGVHLGRFAPYTKGHKNLTKAIIQRHWVENSLIMIWSSNVFNLRTPFTFEQRKKIIELIIPGIKIIPLPDTNPNALYHDTSWEKINKWILSIKKIQNQFNTRFKFYWWSEQDLKYLKTWFETEELINRGGDWISATQVREYLKTWEHEKLKWVLDDRIIPIACHYFNENMEQLLIDW